MSTWNVAKGRLDLGKGTMGAGCHHRKGKLVACGGCYARFYLALRMIQDGADGKKIADEVFAATKAEFKEGAA